MMDLFLCLFLILFFKLDFSLRSMYFSLMPLSSLKMMNTFKCFAVSGPNQGRNQAYRNFPICDDRKPRSQLCIILIYTSIFRNNLCIWQPGWCDPQQRQTHRTLKHYFNTLPGCINEHPRQNIKLFLTCTPIVGTKLPYGINK